MPVQEAKYQQVIDWIKENIGNGTFRAGDKLMSEAELSERFGLSRQTIRRATGELVNENLVTRVRGSGTYIAGSMKKERALRPRSMNVAVVSTFYESYIFPDTLKGIEKVLSHSGYVMQVYFTDNRLYREKEILESILKKNDIDGMIVEPAKSALPNPNIPYYLKLRELGVPIVFFNSFYPEIDAPCVRIDDEKAAMQAADLLIRAGHTDIAGIFKSDDGQGRLRYKGYLEALMAAGLTTNQERVMWLDTPETIRLSDIGDYLLSRIGGCTGVVCYNDQVAYQLIELALQKGIRVPEDLSVVGIDDSYLASIGKVPITSFVHPKEELGKKVAEKLIRLIDNPDENGDYLFESEPVPRSSVAVRERSSETS